MLILDAERTCIGDGMHLTCFLFARSCLVHDTWVGHIYIRSSQDTVTVAG